MTLYYYYYFMALKSRTAALSAFDRRTKREYGVRYTGPKYCNNIQSALRTGCYGEPRHL